MQGERKTRAAEKSADADLAYKSAYADYLKSGKGEASGGASGALYKKAEDLSKDKNSKFFGQTEKAYEFLKRGFNRNEDQIEWNKAERDMIKNGASSAEIATARKQWFGPSRGYAPANAVAALKSGINPASKNTFTEQDLEDFNRTYPNTQWQDILGANNAPKPPPVTQSGSALPVPR